MNERELKALLIVAKNELHTDRPYCSRKYVYSLLEAAGLVRYAEQPIEVAWGFITICGYRLTRSGSEYWEGYERQEPKPVSSVSRLRKVHFA